MDEKTLTDLLRSLRPDEGPSAPGPRPAPDFANSLLDRLPGMRYVIPGSHPGLRVLVAAGSLALLTAALTALLQRPGKPTAAAPNQPPPSPLFQPTAAEPPVPN